ncbi:response regulator transcription factor [Desulfobotulus sp. H1]|uniref:Response regulator transcription factor n=1 Tax=Desulfobotulus pelophilus TaxID=2823377 RepID=A0ABT3N6E5_9BACT|nr:response regulator transcription factor [Desulfobotulus pelophilus]MCW7753014.1 response regulator transcription factor [Desulfobotulus pelophilus]
MLSVLLVEDDLDLAETLIDYLALESVLCDHAGNGMAGMQLIRNNCYDVILLDINLPRMDGLHVCETVRREGKETPVLMLTARGQLEDKLEGFGAGADDYLVKPFELKELVVRIHALAGRRSGQTRLLRCGDLEMNMMARRVTRAGKEIRLSPTGWKILEALMRSTPETVSRQKLTEAVWGEDPPDSDSLKVHLFHLRKALDAPFEQSMIQTVPGHGFAIREKGSP